MDVTRSWEESLTGRALGLLLRWAAASGTARFLNGLAAFLAAAWRGSLAGRFLAQDLAGTRLPAGSRVAAALGRVARRTEAALQAAGQRCRTAWGSAQVGRAARSVAAGAGQGTTLFLAGTALGLAGGMLVLGWIQGGLTPRRLAAALLAALAGALLAALPGEAAGWWKGSLVVRLSRWLINLGKGEGGV